MNWGNIPEGMRSRAQWMLTDQNKAPLALDIGTMKTYPGSKTRPDQRLGFDDACFFAEELGLLIGYLPLPDDPFTIIDLDHKDSKVYDVDAEEIKTGLFNDAINSTYVEISLSGKGAHIVVEGKVEHDFNAHSAGIECYGNRGFVVMTGNMVSQTNRVANYQSSLDWLSAKYPNAIEHAKVEGLRIDWEQINNASAEEKALDDQFAIEMDSWRNQDRINKWFTEEGDDRSGYDAKVMQLFVKFSKDRKYPDETAIRMFLRSPRAQWLNRKPDPQQYVARTLVYAKACIANDEKIAKQYDMSEGSRAFLEQSLANIASAKATPTPASGIAPIAAPFTGFSWLTADDLDVQADIAWVVKGLFPIGGVGAIYGESGAGKSFVAIDMIAAIAEGRKWFNLRTTRLPVSVFALEGEGGLKGRKRAWEAQNNRKYPHNVFFWDSVRNGSFALRDGDGRSTENRERLVKLCADLIASGRRGGVVVIDTLNQASDGADENSSRDMGELLRAMKFIQRETGSLVLIVHHATKSKENQSMRGHSSLYGAMDGIMEVIREVYTEDAEPKLIENRRAWRAVKVKDGRDGYEKRFDMKEHQVGFDEDGPINSISIEEVPEYIVEEQTGEIRKVSVGTTKRPSGNSGKKSGSRGAQGISSQAPEVTRPRDKPVWSAQERSGENVGNETGGWSGMKPQQAIRDSITAECAVAKTHGRHGGPNSTCAPRSAVLERAIVLRNYPNPSVGKRDLDRAIDAMIAAGKLGSEMVSGKIQWVWLKE